MGDNVRARNSPIVHAVFNVSRGRLHSPTAGSGDYDSLLVHHVEIRAVNHPAPAVMIEKRLNLPRRMEAPNRTAEYNQLRLRYSAVNRL